MTTDTTEKGLERLICTALTGNLPCGNFSMLRPMLTRGNRLARRAPGILRTPLLFINLVK